ncbi:MAG: BspA family leucine-rich repeat surface protein [Corynebacterium sp.]|nr:BspA family leucine-rich repeat surface protein [Corynebacterium sp.]
MKKLLSACALGASLILTTGHLTHADSTTQSATFTTSTAKTSVAPAKRIFELGANGTQVTATVEGRKITVAGDGSGTGHLDKARFHDMFSQLQGEWSDRDADPVILLRFDEKIYLPEDSSELFKNWPRGIIRGLHLLDTSQVTSMRAMFKGAKPKLAVQEAEDLGWDLSRLTDYSEFCADSKLGGRKFVLTMPGFAKNTDWNRGCDILTSQVLKFNLGADTNGGRSLPATYVTGDNVLFVGGSTDAQLDRAAALELRDWLIANDVTLHLWSLRLPEDSSSLFKGLKRPVVGLQALDTSGVVDMSEMFQDAQVDFSQIAHWDVRNVKSFKNMFSGTRFDTSVTKHWLIHPEADITNALGTNPPPAPATNLVTQYFDLPQKPEEQEAIRNKLRGPLSALTNAETFKAQLKGVNAPFTDADLRLAHTFWEHNRHSTISMIADAAFPERETMYSRNDAEWILSLFIFVFYPEQRITAPGYQTRLSTRDMAGGTSGPANSEEATDTNPPTETHSTPAQENPEPGAKSSVEEPTPDAHEKADPDERPNASKPAPKDEGVAVSSGPVSPSADDGTDPPVEESKAEPTAEVSAQSEYADGDSVQEGVQPVDSDVSEPQSTSGLWLGIGVVSLILAALSGVVALLVHLPHVAALPA